jgi:hypothetical protein
MLRCLSHLGDLLLLVGVVVVWLVALYKWLVLTNGVFSTDRLFAEVLFVSGLCRVTAF